MAERFQFNDDEELENNEIDEEETPEELDNDYYDQTDYSYIKGKGKNKPRKVTKKKTKTKTN